MRTLLLLTLCVSTGALAIARGGTLYIRSTDAALLKEPKAKAPMVMKLARGTEVIWNGPSDKDKQWQEVMVMGKKGFVRITELSPHKPQLELDSSSGKPMSAEAFASSGAATKDGDMGRGSPQRSPSNSAAAAELIYVEELNKAKATPEALEAKELELRGP